MFSMFFICPSSNAVDWLTLVTGRPVGLFQNLAAKTKDKASIVPRQRRSTSAVKPRYHTCSGSLPVSLSEYF